VGQHIVSEHSASTTEIQRLQSNINHIKEIVNTQQNYAGKCSVVTELDIQDIVNDSLALNATFIEEHSVKISIATMTATIETDKHRVMQILVNIIRNGIEAMVDADITQPHIDIDWQITDTAWVIRIQDNGPGIAKEHVSTIFQHGFTTKTQGHGFGLHSSACFAKELGGQLRLDLTVNNGACFVLELPQP